MANFTDVFTAPNIAAYWNALEEDRTPLLGEMLFPAKRQVGLRLDWVKGHHKAPVVLAPSAFDAKPTLRDRGGIELMSMSMPFFRESMRISEQDRQNLLTLQGNNALLDTALGKLFDDATALINSALVTPEVMRFEAMLTGKVVIESQNAAGSFASYAFDYDPGDTWAGTNTVEGVNIANDNLVAVLMNQVRAAASKGVSLTRAVVSPATWSRIATNAAVLKMANPAAAMVSDTDLTGLLSSWTGLQFTIYGKQYTDKDGNTKSFMADDQILLLPGTPVGSTFFGTTPEEADLMGGNTSDKVEVVSGGIAVHTLTETLPVNVITTVSEIVLPSFEAMNAVYNVKLVA